ncbi:hypothetical protein IKI14_07470 [bacterium]|nr:hypothetical protein [bacterium]MBR7037610.1 hypothetical protein [bacterium]
MDQFLSIVILRFVASHIIMGSFTEISAASGKIFCANKIQRLSHNVIKTQSTVFFILWMIEIKINESDFFLYCLNFRLQN